MVEATAVSTLLGQLVDEGVLWHVNAFTVLLNGVYLVDGQILKVGVVDHEGLSFVGIGREGTVAENLHLVSVMVVASAVGIDGPLIA